MSSVRKDKWEQYVTPNLTQLVKKLKPSSLLENLRECGLLTPEDVNSLRHGCSTEQDRTRKLLYDILPYKGNDSFDRFCNVLSNVEEQAHIVTEVLEVEIETASPVDSDPKETEKMPQRDRNTKD